MSARAFSSSTFMVTTRLSFDFFERLNLAPLDDVIAQRRLRGMVAADVTRERFLLALDELTPADIRHAEADPDQSVATDHHVCRESRIVMAQSRKYREAPE